MILRKSCARAQSRSEVRMRFGLAGQKKDDFFNGQGPAVKSEMSSLMGFLIFKKSLNVRVLGTNR